MEEQKNLTTEDLWHIVKKLQAIDANDWTGGYLTWTGWVTPETWQTFCTHEDVWPQNHNDQNEPIDWALGAGVNAEVSIPDQELYAGVIEVKFHLG